MRSCEKIVFARHTKCNEAIHFFSFLRGSGDSHNEAIQNKNMDCHESLRDSRNDEIPQNKE